MKGKLNKILTSLIAAMLLTGIVFAFDVPVQSHPGNNMWMEDASGSSNIYYETTNATIGTTFTLTMFLNTNLAKVGSWQFQMYFDSSWLTVTSCIYSGTGNSKSQFFEKAGTTNIGVSPTIGAGSLLFAESYLAGTYAGSANSPSSLCYMTFQITAIPAKGQTLTTEFDLTTSPDTYIQDDVGTKTTGIGINATIGFKWTTPPSPGMGVKTPYTPFPTGKIFYNDTNHIGETFDVPLYILGLDPAWILANVSFNLNFDNTLIVPFAPKVTFDSAFTGYFDDTTAGTIYIFATNTSLAASGDVLVATAKFQILNQGIYPSTLTSYLDFDNTTIFDIDMEITGLQNPVNGGVTVQGYLAAPFPYLAVEPSTIDFGPAPALGQTFCVDIKVKRLSWYWHLVGLDFRLSYDPTYLAYVSATEGPYFPLYPQFVPPPQNTVFVAFDMGNNVAILDLILPDPNAPDPSSLYPNPLPGGYTPPDYTDGGEGVVATVCFRVIKQDVACTPQNYTIGMDIYDSLLVDWQDVHITTEPPQNAVVTIYGSFETGRYIDVFTEYVAPYGGQGLFMPSDMFFPQKLVCVTAYVAYNCWPLQNKLVTFTVLDNQGAVWTQMTAPTNTTGYAVVCFRMPWPCDNPESLFGIWSVRADVDVACIGIYDIVTWHYDYLINIVKVTTDKYYYNHQEYVCVNVEFTSHAQQTYHVGMYVTIMDNLSYPIATQGIEFDIGGAQYCTPKEYSRDFCLLIPKFASAGPATVVATSRLYWDGRYSAEDPPVPQWIAAGPQATAAIYILPA